MHRYIFVLLLINACYRSLGIPINPTAPISLVNSLTALASQCENTFLSNQIKSKIIYCSDLSSPHGEKQLQCLIYYDINKQLCEAVAAAKVALPEEDYTTKINEEQDVNSLCITAKDWVFSNLTEFSRYKQAVDKIFKHPVTCGKVCSVEDFMSDESNYFCKYFKWGSDVLQQQVAVPLDANNNEQPPPDPQVKDKSAVPALSSGDLQDIQIKDSAVTKLNIPTSNTPVQNEEGDKLDMLKSDTSPLAINQKSQSVESKYLPNVAAVPETQANIDPNLITGDTKVMPDNAVVGEDGQSKSPENVSKVDTVQEVTSKLDTQKEPDLLKMPKSGDETIEDKELDLLNKDLDIKQAVLETPQGKPPSGVVDFQAAESEEEKEGLSDMQGGDDGDDPALAEMDEKPEEQKVEKTVKAVISDFVGEKDEHYTGSVQEPFPEDDDNFFPFFLTAIILVVLLYILYHNKNKVTKVFFGLVLEGRQATRRRNSRGHAYRRLDTLEQAMSASAAAPPSKIIY